MLVGGMHGFNQQIQTEELCGLWRREGKDSRVIMGGDPVTTEPTILKIVDSWSDGKVSINGLDFSINEVLIAKVSGLLKEGEVITRDKTNQGIPAQTLGQGSNPNREVYSLEDSSKEEHIVSEVGKFGQGGSSLKMAEADPVAKGPAKGPDETQTLTKELRYHLKVLNGLGGSLSSTCACINLLTLEITNYLKEVVKNLKDLSAAKEQQNPIGK
eukprot:Gb_40874 [translate_table: standard]